MYKVNAAAEVIYDLVDPSANLIFGAVVDPSLTGQVSFLVQTLYGKTNISEKDIFSFSLLICLTPC